MPQLPISDEYFNRSAAVVTDTPVFNQRVRYCVFARKGGVICGINRAVAFVEQNCVGPLVVRSLNDGERFEPRQAVMVIEGLFGELVNLETTYLGMLAFSGAATQMDRIVQAARSVPVIDMAARHYPYEIIEQTAYAAAIGGAVGTSTAAGHRYVIRWLGINANTSANANADADTHTDTNTNPGQSNWIRVNHREPVEFRLYGSIPHALNAVYDGSSIESAKAYFKKFPHIALNVLIDFEGRELDVCREAAGHFGKNLAAVRIDTHGSRVHQGGHDKPVPELVEHILGHADDRDATIRALEHYGFGPGVTVESIFAVRKALDDTRAHHVRIVVSSGFNAEKTAAFRACNAPMDAIGTGSWVSFLVFTSDITHVLKNGKWIDRCKAGRSGEIAVPNLTTRVERS